MKRFTKIIILIICFSFSYTCASGSKTVRLSNKKSLEEQLAFADTKYIVRNVFDLKGGTIILPKNSRLHFRKGSIINGILLCNQAKLTGNVSVNQIAGSIATETFLSSWSNLPPNETKMTMLLNLEVNQLNLNENFSINHFPGTFVSNIHKLDACGSTIDVNCDLIQGGKPNYLLRLDSLCSIKNITFRGNGHRCAGVIDTRLGEIGDIRNITITDFSNLGISSGIVLMKINVSNNSKISVRDINIGDIKSQANGIIGDADGNITGIYVLVKKNDASEIDISNCYFEDLHNYDQHHNIILEDVSGIYVHQDYPYSKRTNVNISDIIGLNPGKRLIKTDGGNICVTHVEAKSDTDDLMYVVGLNNGDKRRCVNAKIEDVVFSGYTTGGVVATAVDSTTITNVTSNITRNPNINKPIVPIHIGAYDCSISQLNLIGSQCLLSCTEGFPIEMSNVTYDDTQCSFTTYKGKLTLCSNNAQFTIDGLYIKSNKGIQLFTDNYPEQSSQHISDGVINKLQIDTSYPYSEIGLINSNSPRVTNVSIYNSSFLFRSNVKTPIRFIKTYKTTLSGITIETPNESDVCEIYIKDNSELNMKNLTVNNSPKKDRIKIYGINKHCIIDDIERYQVIK